MKNLYNLMYNLIQPGFLKLMKYWDDLGIGGPTKNLKTLNPGWSWVYIPAIWAKPLSLVRAPLSFNNQRLGFGPRYCICNTSSSVSSLNQSPFAFSVPESISEVFRNPIYIHSVNNDIVWRCTYRRLADALSKKPCELKTCAKSFLIIHFYHILLLCSCLRILMKVDETFIEHPLYCFVPSWDPFHLFIFWGSFFLTK